MRETLRHAVLLCLFVACTLAGGCSSAPSYSGLPGSEAQFCAAVDQARTQRDAVEEAIRVRAQALGAAVPNGTFIGWVAQVDRVSASATHFTLDVRLPCRTKTIFRRIAATNDRDREFLGKLETGAWLLVSGSLSPFGAYGGFEEMSVTPSGALSAPEFRVGFALLKPASGPEERYPEAAGPQLDAAVTKHRARFLESLTQEREVERKPATAIAPTAAELLGVPADFVPRYEVVETRRVDVATSPRLSVRVHVPRGLTRAELDMNVRHALLRAYEGGPVRFGAVGVGASTSATLAPGFEAASADFAPNGQWSAADPDAPLSSWKVSVSVEDHYFRTVEVLPVGTRAVLVLSAPEFSDTVSLSSKPNRWLEEDQVAELKPGTPVVVVGNQDFGRAGVRYEVETTSKQKRRGWVHSFDLKSE